MLVLSSRPRPAAVDATRARCQSFRAAPKKHSFGSAMQSAATLVLTVFTGLAVSDATAAPKPLKIIILAGQSNSKCCSLLRSARCSVVR